MAAAVGSRGHRAAGVVCACLKPHLVETFKLSNDHGLRRNSSMLSVVSEPAGEGDRVVRG